MIKLWKFYSAVALVTLVVNFLTSLRFSIASAPFGLSEIIKIFWFSNLFFYMGLSIIIISVLRRNVISLIVGFLLLYPVGKQLYQAMFVDSHILVGLDALLQRSSLFFAVVTEIVVLILIYCSIFKNRFPRR